MTDRLLPDDEVEPVVGSLTDKLTAWSETLEARQRKILEHLIYRAMDPLDRVALNASDDLLDSTELETLRRLEEKG